MARRSSARARRVPLHATALVAALTCLAAPLRAQEQIETQATKEAAAGLPQTVAGTDSLDKVEISARHYDNAIGTSDAASQGTIRAELLKSRPALRPGEVLEFVPGMIVTQHSGDGKANQYFLRGFNLDHGTDFATTVNGLPVNMPTNGHGQGYSDLNFLIPELVERIEYRKGPYFARNGDFSSAGSADIVYRTRLDAPLAAVTLGEHAYKRLVGAGSSEVAPGTTLLGALELMGNNGPWTVAEKLRRLNGVVTASTGNAQSGATLSLMSYTARWTATDQVPERLITAGSYNGAPFGRFDSVNPTDGGSTGRHSLSGQWYRSDDDSRTQVSGYAMRYRLKLFNDFTYALERPVDGDQFSQQDSRSVFGLNASHVLRHSFGDLQARTEIGMQLRHDRIHVGLFDAVGREITATTRKDAVRETLASVYAENGVGWLPWLRTIVGLRADRFDATVDSLTNGANSGNAGATQVSPKLSVVLGPWAQTEFFANAGRGFHSNDARGTTTQVDPRTGDPVDRVPGLVASRGWELGARTEAVPGLQSSLAFWKLDFDSELVYVGDAGVTEPNRPSTRYGIEWNNRWTPRSWLLFDADLAWTHARFSDDDPAGNRIPQAVDQVASVAATLRDLGPWSASLGLRYLGAGALIEDNAVRSRPAVTTNLRVGYRFGFQAVPKAELTLDVFNLFDRKVNDIEYFYESQLRGEAAPVADRHVHPAEPRTVRVTLRATF